MPMAAAPPKQIGKYHILGLLGKGGMGEVYKALQPDLDRHVAIKLMIAGEHASEEMIRRFQREAQVAAKIQHPGIVQVYDFGSEGKLHYFVMELVEGRSLKQLIESRSVAPDQAVRIAVAAARALHAAHERGIVHRDVKPGNIMIDSKGRVRVADFGLAKIADGKLTASGALLGTPYYMSPEQAFGAPEEVTARSDIYGLGAVLYEMLTGRTPFTGATAMAVLRKLESEEPPAPGVSPAIDAIVLRALAKDPKKRFASAKEFADELAARLTESAATVVQKQPDAPGGRRALVVAMAGGVLVVGAMLVWALRGGGKPPEPEPPADAAARIKTLIAEGSVLKLEEALRELKEQPALRADVHRRLGRFRRAAAERARLTDDESRCRRTIDNLAGLTLRFAAPGVFELPDDELLKQEEKAIATPHRKFLVGALQRLFAGNVEAAAQRLDDAAEIGADKRDIAFVRAEVELHRYYRTGDAGALDAALKATEGFDAPEMRVQRATAFMAKGDRDAARKESDRLLEAAPNAAESYALRAWLYRWQENWDEARYNLERAWKADPQFDDGNFGEYVDVLEHIANRSPERFTPEAERELLKDLGDETTAMSHLLRAWAAALRSKWEEVASHLKKFDEETSSDGVVVEPPQLGNLANARGSRAWQLAAGRDLLADFGLTAEAIAAGKAALGRSGEIGEEERKEFERDAHYWLAATHAAGDKAVALAHLEEALKRGAGEAVRADEQFAPLREDDGYKALMAKYPP